MKPIWCLTTIQKRASEMEILKRKEIELEEETRVLTLYGDVLEVSGHTGIEHYKNIPFYLITETVLNDFPQPPYDVRYLGMSNNLSYALCDALKIDDPGFITDKHISFFREILEELLQKEDSHKKELELKLEYLEKYIKLPELDFDAVLGNFSEEELQ